MESIEYFIVWPSLDFAKSCSNLLEIFLLVSQTVCDYDELFYYLYKFEHYDSAILIEYRKWENYWKNYISGTFIFGVNLRESQ